VGTVLKFQAFSRSHFVPTSQKVRTAWKGGDEH